MESEIDELFPFWDLFHCQEYVVSKIVHLQQNETNLLWSNFRRIACRLEQWKCKFEAFYSILKEYKNPKNQADNKENTAKSYIIRWLLSESFCRNREDEKKNIFNILHDVQFSFDELNEIVRKLTHILLMTKAINKNAIKQLNSNPFVLISPSIVLLGWFFFNTNLSCLLFFVSILLYTPFLLYYFFKISQINFYLRKMEEIQLRIVNGKSRLSCFKQKISGIFQKVNPDDSIDFLTIFGENNFESDRAYDICLWLKKIQDII